MISTSDILHGKILIVDDQEANVLLLERMLGSAGYDSITSTINPGEVCGLHLENRYDLILLDLQMPGIDGFQVMEGLKEIETGDYIPVLVITAQPGHKLRAFQAGAKDFISKPLELPEVLARVHNMLEVRLLHKELHNYTDMLEQRVRERTAELSAEITERKRAEEDARHRLSELEMLYTTSLVIGQLLQPKEIGQKITEILSDRLHWHHAVILQYHTESETLELLAFHQPGLENEAERLAAEERLKAIITRPGQGFVGLVSQHGQPIFCGDVTKDRRYIGVWPEIRSGMYIPLKVSERMIGCLGVESEQVNAFTETDEWLITTLATQAASALENARLFEETSRRLKHVQALRTIDKAIAINLDLRVTLDVFLDEVVRQLGVDAADVFLFNPHTQTLEYIAGRGFHTKAIREAQVRLGEGHAGRAALERHLVQIPNLKDESEYILSTTLLTGEDFICYYGVPLIAKGQVKGVLEVYHRAALEPDPEWLDFLNTLAGQAAIAIENATLFENLQRSNSELALAYDATIEGWSHALDLRDKETEGHTQRVTEMAVKLARAFGLSEAELVQVRWGALLHDIGKMGVPDGILLKPGSLTDEEWVVMKKHPTFAYEMLSPIRYLRQALDIPYCHHEKWDGTGYPRGLKGEQIPLVARIFSIVDVWDALCSDRPYRAAWSKAKALDYIREQSETHFDLSMAELFLKVMSEKAHKHKQRPN